MIIQTWWTRARPDDRALVALNMRFGMRSRNEVGLDPVEVFPGDETISADTYRLLMAGGYVAIVEYLKAGADSVGLTIDPVTEERWRRLISAAYYIDDFMDSADDMGVAGQLYEAGLSAAVDGGNVDELLEVASASHESNPLLVPSIRALNNSVAGVDPEQLEKLRQSALTIKTAALQKAQISDIAEYIELLAEESAATSGLLDSIADERTVSQPKYATFSDVIHKAMTVSVYLDHALDLRDDFEQGTTAVKPTIRNMGQLAIQAVAPAYQAARWGDSLKMSWRMIREIRPYIKPS